MGQADRPTCPGCGAYLILALPPGGKGLCLGGIMAKPTEEQIRQRAQEIWEENHRPDGRDEEFWLQAEKELSQGTTSDEKSETFLE
jgi:DUF2934 family protein